MSRRQVAFLTIRNIDSETDPEAGRYGAPRLGANWDVVRVRAAPGLVWSAHKALNDKRLLIVRLNLAAAGRAVYYIRGDRTYLRGIGAEAGSSRTVMRWAMFADDHPRVLADGGSERRTKARLIVKRLRHWLCDVSEPATQEDVDAGDATAVGDLIRKNNVMRELCVEGVSLPALWSGTLPWWIDPAVGRVPRAASTYRIHALHTPSLSPGGVPWTMAGHGDHLAIESEPDEDDEQ